MCCGGRVKPMVPEKVLCIGTPATHAWLSRVLNPDSDWSGEAPKTNSKADSNKIVVTQLFDENELADLTYDTLERTLRTHYQISRYRYWLAVLGNFDPDSVSKIAVVWDEALLPLYPKLAELLHSLRSAAKSSSLWRPNCFAIFPLTFVVISTSETRQREEASYLQDGADIIVDSAEEPEWILLDRIQARIDRLNRLAEQLSFSRLLINARLVFCVSILAAMCTGVVGGCVNGIVEESVKALWSLAKAEPCDPLSENTGVPATVTPQDAMTAAPANAPDAIPAISPVGQPVATPNSEAGVAAPSPSGFPVQK